MKIQAKTSKWLRRCHGCELHIFPGVPYLLVRSSVSGIFCLTCVEFALNEAKKMKV